MIPAPTTRLALLATSLLSLLLIPAPSVADDKKPDDKVFAAYLYGRPQEINFSLYTHLFHAFVVPNSDGSVKSSGSAPSRDLNADAHKNGVKVVLSLGGWGWDNQFAALSSKPETEDRHVKQVMEMVDEYDYDGIDFDWEYPDTETEVVNFERLARRFRAELDQLAQKKNRPMVLTMAVAANPGTIRWLKTDFLLETLDWVNIMTYDYAGDWANYAGHNSPLHASPRQPNGPPRSVELTMRYLLDDRKLPPSHIVLGIPLYGRGFSVSAPYASTQNAPKTRLPRGTYANLVRLKDQQGWTREWDDQIKAPWLLAPDKSAVFGYDDPESVALKTRWGMTEGLRGIFFWEISQDRLDDGSNPLQQAAHEAWKTATTPSP